MINLIPNEEKKRKARDFYFRLLVVFIFMLATFFFILSISILPSYVLSSVRKNFSNDKLVTQKNEPVPEINQKSLAVIKDLDNKLTIIEKSEKNIYSVTGKIINEVLTKKMSDIKITKISYENDPLNGKKINILGAAPSRERLLSFRRALEEDINFKKVDLPISNFVKGSNIQFSLSVIPI